jgi:hypothetical protein
MLQSMLALLQSVLDEEVITIHIALITFMRTWDARTWRA